MSFHSNFTPYFSAEQIVVFPLLSQKNTNSMPFLCLYFFGFYYISNVVKFDVSVTKVVGDFVGESICSLSCPFAVFKRVFARFHRTFGVLHAIKKDPKNWVIFSLHICEQSKQKTIFFYLLLLPSRCRKK